MVNWTGFRGDLDARSRYISFTFGFSLVAFLWVVGWGIDNATTVIDLSSRLITIARSASIGLGTGYYLGATLTKKETSERWIFLGVFLAVTTGAISTSVMSIISDQVSIAALLQPAIIVIGVLVSILAHQTPAIQTNEQYKQMFYIISGYVTTAVVAVLASINYITLILNKIDTVMSDNASLVIGASVIFLAGGYLGMKTSNSSSDR
jgi:hypothetical protein